MDITKTYPAKISPAVPRTFRTTLNVLIGAHLLAYLTSCFDAVGTKEEVLFTTLTIPSNDEGTSGVCGPIPPFRRGGGCETDSADAGRRNRRSKVSGE